jgi:hypothetical protein
MAQDPKWSDLIFPFIHNDKNLGQEVESNKKNNLLPFSIYFKSIENVTFA